jgi:hypothetical protein
MARPLWSREPKRKKHEMGMFDSLYDKDGNEWQTKAFARNLARYEIGDAISSPPIPYQVEVLGDMGDDDQFIDSYATIRDRRLAEVPADRDNSLPLLGFDGEWRTN